MLSIYSQHHKILVFGSFVSKIHWATHRRQSPLSTQLSNAPSHNMPMSFNSCLMVSIQFFLGLRFMEFVNHCMTCFGSLPLSIARCALNISVFFLGDFFQFLQLSSFWLFHLGICFSKGFRLSLIRWNLLCRSFCTVKHCRHNQQLAQFQIQCRIDVSILLYWFRSSTYNVRVMPDWPEIGV